MPMPDADNLTGSQQAAMLLLMMGEEKAAEVLRYVDSAEVERISMAMAAIRDVDNKVAETVIDRFQDALEKQTPLGVGVPSYVRNVLKDSLGEDKGRTLADKVLGDEHPLEMDSLRWLDLDTLVHLLKDEHPQILAITLAHMAEEQAAYIIGKLDPEIQEDVVMRIASMDKIPQAALQELQGILKNKISLSSSFKSKTIDGVSTAAGIMNSLGKESEHRLLDAIARQDAKLSEKVQELMFIFGNLADLDNKGMQQLLREIPSDLLTVALKGADEKVKAKFFSNMSKRAGEMLREDMEARGAVKLSEVETAQKEILMAAKRLAEAGTIVLGKGTDDYVE